MWHVFSLWLIPIITHHTWSCLNMPDRCQLLPLPLVSPSVCAQEHCFLKLSVIFISRMWEMWEFLCVVGTTDGLLNTSFHFIPYSQRSKVHSQSPLNLPGDFWFLAVILAILGLQSIPSFWEVNRYQDNISIIPSHPSPILSHAFLAKAKYITYHSLIFLLATNQEWSLCIATGAKWRGRGGMMIHVLSLVLAS